ncbi:MetS family NSS transporter small subunit [Salinibacillus xinjiangensis]|uniref:MetS family NSS transporter small subunit n=1 Tax=Salinibacillus xinjiangensis TaxID=1229268 RepID=A0A6G1X2M2_9BACI|nr:MetS family NSS transporter small subunit [Salinibacillus xinjiangensis]MRG85169.1 MetS family NSS transporter small subunit [Salinibacillus xinjiangensis]
MTGSAIAMFVIGGVIIWGGLIASIVYARKVAKSKTQ